MHDANQLFVSHADQPADAPAAGCDTIDEHTIFELDKEEEPEEEDEDESAAAPSSSSVTGAAIKRKRTMDKFLALRIVYGKGPRWEHGRDRHGSAEEDQDSHMDRAGDACSLAGPIHSCQHGIYQSCFAGDDAPRGCSMYRFRFADDRQEWRQQLHLPQHGKAHQVQTQ